MAAFHLITLGTLRLVGPRGELLTGRRKELTLLAYLVRRAPRPASRDELATLLWGDRPQTRARQSLRQAILQIRRALPDVLVEENNGVAVRPEAVDADANLLEADVAAGRWSDAAERWGGDFLDGTEDVGADTYRAWVEAEREALRRRVVAAMTRLADGAEARGDWREAARWGERWAMVMPLDEAAHRTWLRALALEGRADEALVQHAAFVSRVRELGDDPEPSFLRLAQELESHSVATRASGPQAAALFAPDLVGRDAAFETLVGAWRRATNGGSAVVVVEGEQGIGKTRLLEEFLRWAESEGETLVALRARGYEEEARHGWTVARDLFRNLLTAPGLAAVPPELLSDASHVLPEIGSRFPRLPRRDPKAGSFVVAIERVLREVAEETPLLLAVDDLHLADAETRDLMLSLARRPPPSTALLLTGTAAGLRNAGLVEPLRRVPGIVRVRLDPLDPSAVESLVASVAELPAGVRHDLARQLHRETGGNPFYLTECLLALAAEGVLALDATGAWRLEGDGAAPLPLPSGVREVTRHRLRRLDRPTRTVLEAAAILGPRVDPALLGRVVGMEDDVLADALDGVVTQRYLRAMPPPTRAYEFRHEVVRRAVIEAMGPVRVRAVHRAAVRALRRIPTTADTRRARLRHVAALGETRWRRRWWFVGGAAVAAVALLLYRPGAGVDRVPTRVAILPFSVRGPAELAYLGEGMTDVLSTAMDRSGLVSTVDPHALLALLRRDKSLNIDPAAGRTVAQEFGAARYVLGTVVAAGGRIRIRASLYEASGTLVGAVERDANDEGEVFAAADRIARQLVALWSPAAGRRLASLAASTSESFPALRAYLLGEAAMRLGEFDDAAAAFERAVRIDSSFALAHYRHAQASWGTELLADSITGQSVEAAERHKHRLSGRDRALLEGYAAWWSGDAARAESLYRELVAVHPDEVEAWFGLALVSFYYDAFRGRPPFGQVEPLDRLLALDPSNSLGRLYRASAAGRQGDWALYDSLLLRTAPALEYRPFASAIRVSAIGTPAEWRATLQEFSTLSGQEVGYGVRLIAVVAWRHRRAVELAGVLADRARPPHDRARGLLFRAALLVGLGEWERARSDLAEADALVPGDARRHRAQWALLPPLRLGRRELEEARDWLAARHARDDDAVVQPTRNCPERLADPYLLGLLAVRLDGDPRPFVAQLANERTGSCVSMSNRFAASIRAEVAWREGRLGDALAELEAHPVRVRAIDWIRSPFDAGLYERYQRAEVLHGLGRDQEALGWYASLGEFVVYAAPLVAPASVRQAEIYDARGEADAARVHYQQFVDIWTGADPGLQAEVRVARERIRVLSGSWPVPIPAPTVGPVGPGDVRER